MVASTEATQQQQHRENLASYKTIAHNLKQLSPEKFQRFALPYQTLKLGIRFEETWLEWSEETREMLQTTVIPAKAGT